VDVPPGFIYIPPGEFLFGAIDEDRRAFFETAPRHRRRTDEFLIGRHEVTFGDWLAYLDSMPPREHDAKLPGVPVERDDQDRRRFPVTAVSAEDAAEYAAWLATTGRVPGARLCGEVEWERAARGADGRDYPHGRALENDDANFDATHAAGQPGLDEVGAHRASTSPYGLADTSGNAFELTLDEQGGYVLRGGSYLHDRMTAHLANRVRMHGRSRHVTVGFRLCATPPLPR
jgi:formylglycine-generating enzyme required for sulfatase activity